MSAKNAAGSTLSSTQKEEKKVTVTADDLPNVGIWADGNRGRALKRLRFTKEMLEGEWVHCTIGSNGVTINGVRIKGRQYLPIEMLRNIEDILGRQNWHEERFRLGGKTPPTLVGVFRG